LCQRFCILHIIHVCCICIISRGLCIVRAPRFIFALVPELS
jgi:hypothetical protein